MRAYTILTAFLVLWPLAARADEIYDNLQRFGLVGTWAIHCDQPMSPANPHSVIYAAPDGRPLRKLVRGGDFADLYSTIESAKIVTADTIATTWRNSTGWTGAQAGVAIDMVIAKNGRRVRTVDSRGSDGTHFIQGGVFTKSGAQAPSMEKCD
jgi:hypothetical protein